MVALAVTVTIVHGNKNAALVIIVLADILMFSAAIVGLPLIERDEE
jgi:hypothetical protein